MPVRLALPRAGPPLWTSRVLCAPSPQPPPRQGLSPPHPPPRMRKPRLRETKKLAKVTRCVEEPNKARPD